LERIPAAIAVLRYLAKQNTLSVIATHDLEVAKACTAVYTLYHFSEQVGEGGLEFDYRLKNGLTTSWNAIRILQHLGFPAEIVEQAAAAVEKEIKWTTK
jgi:DNA mismatch repair ATPase MutS